MKRAVLRFVLTPIATILLVGGTTFTATQTSALDHACAAIHCQKEPVARVPNDLYISEDDMAEPLERTNTPYWRKKYLE